MTWAEDRAPVGTDPSADPGAVSERRAAGCRPPSPFAYSTNAINPIRNYYLPPANPRLPGFHFTLNQDTATKHIPLGRSCLSYSCTACLGELERPVARVNGPIIGFRLRTCEAGYGLRGRLRRHTPRDATSVAALQEG